MEKFFLELLFLVRVDESEETNLKFFETSELAAEESSSWRYVTNGSHSALVPELSVSGSAGSKREEKGSESLEPEAPILCK